MLLEQDQPASRPMLLCVCNITYKGNGHILQQAQGQEQRAQQQQAIKSAGSQAQVQLTDGWYGVKAVSGPAPDKTVTGWQLKAWCVPVHSDDGIWLRIVACVPPQDGGLACHSSCAVLCWAMLHCAMLCYAMLCYAMLCYAMLCYAMLCYAMLCYAMLCYAMLCYAMLHLAMMCRAVLQCAVLH